MSLTAADHNLLVLAPLSVEARAVRAGAPWADVHRIDDHSITLRPGYHRYSAHLPTAHRGVDV